MKAHAALEDFMRQHGPDKAPYIESQRVATTLNRSIPDKSRTERYKCFYISSLTNMPFPNPEPYNPKPKTLL